MIADHDGGTKLATEYEAVRRKEYEMITNLLELLPRIESVGDERVTQVRDALFHADHPYLAVFVGPFSSGKSSLINALMGNKTLLRVGPTPTTDRVTILRWGEETERMSSGGEVDTVFHNSSLLKKVSFVDTPGLESVFRQHEAATQRFLHRSDTVFMVMLATQAMSAANLESLQRLKEYGKNIIILINQSDLLTEEEKASVQEYVQDQSQAKLGYKPDVWMVSAHLGRKANEGETRDEELWNASGLNLVEAYISDQLSDVIRLRQKLQTPLQITQNVNHAAMEAVRANQAVFDKYTNIAENVKTQISAQERNQQKAINETKETITQRFDQSTERGSKAIQELFSLTRALGSVGRGTLELFRLGNLIRPQGSTVMRVAFEKHQAFEPLDDLPTLVDSLGSQIEGRDLQDMDNLVKYCQEQAQSLPAPMQSKMIGSIRAPQNYDRDAILNARDDLETIEDQTRNVQTDNLDDMLRNTVIYLAVYELILLIFMVALGGILISQPDAIVAVMLVLVLGVMLLGLAFVPLRGRMVANDYAKQMVELRDRYLERLTKATKQQIAHGMKLRRDVATPLTSLIEAQTETQNEQMKQLQDIQQSMVEIEASLAEMGKRRLLAGLRN